jgi:hypothetical protein
MLSAIFVYLRVLLLISAERQRPPFLGITWVCGAVLVSDVKSPLGGGLFGLLWLCFCPESGQVFFQLLVLSVGNPVSFGLEACRPYFFYIFSCVFCCIFVKRVLNFAVRLAELLVVSPLVLPG